MPKTPLTALLLKIHSCNAHRAVFFNSVLLLETIHRKVCMSSSNRKGTVHFTSKQYDTSTSASGSPTVDYGMADVLHQNSDEVKKISKKQEQSTKVLHQAKIQHQHKPTGRREWRVKEWRKCDAFESLIFSRCLPALKLLLNI